MGYIDRLAARLVEPRPLVRPRPLSRFEAADPLTAQLQDSRMAGEEDALLAPPLRARPARPADDRGDEVRQIASITPPAGTEAIASPADQRRASVTDDIPVAPSTRDASTSAARDVGMPPRRAPAPAMAEPFDAAPAQRPASHPAIAAAMPSSFESPSQRPGAGLQTSPAPPVPAPPDSMAPPGMADRISPWRAPAERGAPPPVDTRTTTQAPTAGAMPQQRAKPDAIADDTPAVVQVTIGRLEVRAPEAPRRPFAKPARAAPRMSLHDYLQRRTQGGGR